MAEVEFARDTLAFAQFFLRMGVTHPWLFRMFLGRLYYAAHHLARRLLAEAGLQPEQWRLNVHQRVLNELQQHYVLPGRMGEEAWEALERLRDLRRTADYNLAARLRLRNMNQGLVSFQTFFDACCQILEVS